MKTLDYYDRNKKTSYKAFATGFVGAILIIIYLALQGCAYQRYHSRNFKPDKKAKCLVYEEKFDGQNTMKYYYKKR